MAVVRWYYDFFEDGKQVNASVDPEMNKNE